MPKTLEPQQLAELNTLRDEYNSLIQQHGENAFPTLQAGVALAQKMDEYGIHDAENYPTVNFQELLGRLDLDFSKAIIQDPSLQETVEYKNLQILLEQHNPRSAASSPQRLDFSTLERRSKSPIISPPVLS